MAITHLIKTKERYKRRWLTKRTSQVDGTKNKIAINNIHLLLMKVHPSSLLSRGASRAIHIWLKNGLLIPLKAVLKGWHEQYTNPSSVVRDDDDRPDKRPRLL